MGVVRNFIDIIGITPENKLASKIKGQTYVEASESEKIYIGNYNFDIKNIYQIIIELEIIDTRVIKAPFNKIVVIDAFKKIKILYYDKNNSVNVFDIKTPYNSFVDLDTNEEINDINIYIVDAYFNLIDKETLYCNMLYLIDICCSYNAKNKKHKKTSGNYTNSVEKKYVKVEDVMEVQKDKFNDLKIIHNDILDELGISNDKFNKENSENNYNINEDILIDLEEEYL